MNYKDANAVDPKAKTTNVIVETSHGNFTIEVFTEQVPRTSKWFLGFVNREFYNGLHFHRIIKDFIVQAGCENSRDMKTNVEDIGFGGIVVTPETRLLDEHLDSAQISNQRGYVSLASTNYANSGNTQFFVNMKDSRPLDFFSFGQSKHTVFGRVVEGFETIEAINSVDTDLDQRAFDRPKADVKINRIYVAK